MHYVYQKCRLLIRNYVIFSIFSYVLLPNNLKFGVMQIYDLMHLCKKF